MTPRRGDWMLTASGAQFWPLDPRVEDVTLFDIAASLSKQCRFAGHCRDLYTVAEHSVLVSQVVPPEHALQALLHDAAEAYCVDVPRPLKRGLGAAYADIEWRIWDCIAARFGVPVELHPSVHAADNAVLLAERHALFDPGGPPWNVPGEPADVTIALLTPTEARLAFIRRFGELTLPAPRA